MSSQATEAHANNMFAQQEYQVHQHTHILPSHIPGNTKAQKKVRAQTIFDYMKECRNPHGV